MDVDALVERMCEARADIFADFADAADVMHEATVALRSWCAECNMLTEENDALRAERDSLREYVTGDARCPCCTETVVCNPGCTFAADCPDDYDAMMYARAALAPAEQPKEGTP
jgi:hypothetical protein